jgi:zinc/manganese transport system substrate-binding protein
VPTRLRCVLGQPGLPAAHPVGRIAACAGLAALLLSGCAASRPASASGAFGSGAAAGRLKVVASVNVWGSVLAQLGGERVASSSIVTNPATDPHDYEPTPLDARTIADAALFVENGIGYDSWAAKARAADGGSGPLTLDVGHLLGLRSGQNPHRWYSPVDVGAVAGAITADLKRLDPGGARYFDERRALFLGPGLAEYHRLISTIRTRYAGTPVGASESIVTPLAAALGLDLLTPPGLLNAISEGSDPSASDKISADTQIERRSIAVFIVNSQNSTPDVAAEVASARRRGIPVVPVTETPSPSTVTFQQWQVRQLLSLAAALARSTGR